MEILRGHATKLEGRVFSFRKMFSAAVALMLLVTLLVPHGAGSSEGAALALLSEGARAALDDATGSVDQVRSVFAEGSLAARVESAIEQSGNVVPDLAPASGLSRKHLELVSELPQDLRIPVEGLLSAVLAAKSSMASVSPGEVHKMMLQERRRLMQAAPARLPSPPLQPTLKKIQRYRRAVEGAAQQGPSLAPSPLGRRLAQKSGPRSRAAALLVATALDLYLPMLRNAEPSQTGPGRAKGCDLLDAVPLLCLGSEADNKYEDSTVLLIDRGGNDVYLNSAGGTFTRPEHENAMVNTSVNVDLGGNDRYLADPKPSNGTNPVDPLNEQPGQEVVAAQGVGISGLGLLFDAAGDDEYLVKSPEPGSEILFSNAFGQGVGMAGGTGLLFDQGGADTYRVEGSGGRAVSASVTGQAASTTGGLAVLADSGLGNETYVLNPGKAAPTDDKSAFLTSRMIYGQAYAGLSEASILYDDGGTDRFSIISESEFMPTVDDYSRVTPPFMWTFGQGMVSGGGEALLIEGAGDTTYEVSHTSIGGSSSISFSQGYAWNTLTSSRAVISDKAGNDIYRAVHDRRFNRRLVQTDACLCDAAEAVVNTLSWILDDRVTAQGAGDGFTPGIGLVHDGAGNDTYAVGIESDISLSLVDKLKRPSLAPILRFSVPVGGIVGGQGISILAVPGIVVDQGTGTDSYNIFSDASVRTKVTSQNWNGKPDMRVITGYPVVGGQGKNLNYANALIDEGGKGDVIRASNTVDSVTLPDRDASYELSQTLWSPVQRLLYAGGDDPAVTSTTSVPACGDPGYHGFGYWVPCSPNPDDPDHDVVANGSGYGYAPLARAELPKLELLEVPEEVRIDPQGFSRFPVSARLTSPAGTPLANVPVHLDLMVGTVPSEAVAVPSAWWSLYQETPLTNAQGIVKARLPLLLLTQGGDDLVPDPNMVFRVGATFDGSNDLYPRHAAEGIEVMEAGPGRTRMGSQSSPRSAERFRN